MAEAERSMGFPKDSIRANLRSKNNPQGQIRNKSKIINELQRMAKDP